MIRTYYAIFLITFFLSCSSSSKLAKFKIKPEIPIAKLNEKGIAVINPNYKRNYYRILPYLFYNSNEVFNEVKGDFYNVKYNLSSNLNIMSGFWSEYGEYKNSLIVLIGMSNSSTIPLKGIPITVKSSKHGVFEKKTKLWGNNITNQIQQRVLFVKKLELNKKYDVINKVFDDVITVKIGEQIYEFLNPEMELK